MEDDLNVLKLEDDLNFLPGKSGLASPNFKEYTFIFNESHQISWIMTKTDI